MAPDEDVEATALFVEFREPLKLPEGRMRLRVDPEEAVVPVLRDVAPIPGENRQKTRIYARIQSKKTHSDAN